MHRVITSTSLLFLLFLATPADALNATTDALRAMSAGDTGRARKLLGKDHRQVLLSARALFLAGDLPRAAAEYRKVMGAAAPHSTAGLQARFGLAGCLARQGKFDQAEALFSEALTVITSEAFRLDIARRFIRLGDETLDPPEGPTKADPRRAEQFYRAAKELAAGTDLAELTTLKVGRCLVDQKRHQEAASWYIAFLDDEANRESKHRIEVSLLAGKSLIEVDRRRARRYLRDLLDERPESAEAAEAAYLLSRTYGFPTPASAIDLARGQAALDRFLSAYPKHAKREEARLERAMAPMHLKRHAEAEDALRALIAAGGQDETLGTARYQLGVCLAAQGRLDEAARAFTAYLTAHPAHKFWSQARASVEQMHWQQAQVALAEERFPAAAELFFSFADQHPAAPQAAEALYRSAEAHLKAEKPAAALRVLATLTSKFANQHWGWQGLLLTGQAQQERGDFTKAKDAYEQAQKAGSPVAHLARGQLEMMEQPSLLVESPKNFTSRDKPVLRWQVRNIETVTVRAFRIQAEDFFRDRAAMDAVTGVDIALCEPDRTFEVKVEGHRKYARIEQEVPLPFTRPGLYLLNLSGKDLEATTAVLITDLGTILKTGGGEVFTFVEDLVRRKPRSGVRVLVAEDGKILAEGRTGADGVFRAPISEEIDPSQVAVLTIDGDHIAWTNEENPDSFAPAQRSPRAFLFSDRPVYRPGDEVHLSGIYREVKDGRYLVDTKRALDLTVSQNGKALLTRQVSLDAYGVFHARIQLDRSANEGHYQFQVSSPDQPTFTGSFQVREFRRLPYELQVKLDRPVFFRGEAISGVISVRTPQGMPAADQEVRYLQAGEPKWHSGRTDESGQVSFSFSSSGFEESQQVRIQVQLMRSHQTAEANALLAVAGFDLRFDLPRDVLFAGQPFEVAIRAETPDGKGKRAGVKVEALRRAKTGGGEVRVFSKALDLDDSGQGKLTLTLPQEGGHVIRVFATDRQGHPVVAERGVSLVGEKEPGIWMDLDSETQTIGKQAEITIHARVPRGLVLLTAETQRVLVHQTFPIQKGENKLRLPIGAELAPNFHLAAAMMDGDDLHQASREVVIDQELSIKIRTDREVYGPGDEVTLTAVVKDGAGKAIDARLLVSVVDESLLAAFPENLPDLLATFHGQRPAAGLETSASNTHRFAEVAGAEVEKAEVREAQTSAAMNALKKQRVKITDKAIHEFEKMAAMEQRAVGGLGVMGSGYGGGGLGARGYGRGAAIRTGKASIAGDFDAGWRKQFQESAIFIHDLATGPDGVASATFRLPDTITRWRITTRGVSRETHLGQAQETIGTSMPFWVKLLLPPSLEKGDRIVPLARLYNHTDKPLAAQVTLGQAGQEQAQQVSIAAHRTAEVSFPALAISADAPAMEFALRASAGSLSDGVIRKVPLRPRGVRQEARAEGLIETRATRNLNLPAEWTQPELEIRASNRLVRFYLGSDLDPLWFGDRPEEALAALEMLSLLGKGADAAVVDLIEKRLQRSLAHLMAVQRADGGWGLSKQSQEPSLPVTATAVRVLARARPLAGRLGWPFPQADLDRAVAWLAGQLSRLPPDDFRARTEIIWALAHVDQKHIPGVLLHRLHRLRSSMPLGAQAALGLAWQQMGRPEQAAEMIAAMTVDLLSDKPTPSEIFWRQAPPVSDVDRIRALQLLALVRPGDRRLDQGKTWLWTRGHLLGWWYPDQAAAAIGALATLLKAESEGARVRIRVSVNGKAAGELELTSADSLQTVQVDRSLLKVGENKIELSLTGSGSCLFSARLSGYRETAPAQGERDPLRMRRIVEPVPEPYRGTPIAAGFSVATADTKRWRNAIAHMPAHRMVTVTLEVDRDFAPPLDHCVLEERIPAGFELVEGSITGHQSHAMRDGQRLAFYLTSAGRKMAVSYQLKAINPGDYRFAPSQLISLSHPGLSHLGPTTDFSVDRADAAAPEVRPTPLELYQRGMQAAEEKDHPAVIANLEALWEGVSLQPGYVNPVLSKLLFATIATADHPRILKYFELAKEKNPSLVIPFDQIAPIQEAYRRAKAHEGGLHLARGVAEAQFVRQLASVGKLEAQNELAEAMDLVRHLLSAYPDNGLTAQAAYSFSQVIYGRADRIAEGEKLKGFDRPALLEEVVLFMAGFLGRHPEHPDAPAALFSLASALVERDRAREAIAWCAVGLERHAKSDLAPALAYLKAFAHFRQGEYGPSLELCRRVEDTAEQEENVDMARYIMAQIHHARGQLDEALTYYRKVRERFRDAEETIAELEKAWFKIPEVVRAPTGKRPGLAVEARNVDELDIRAYKVDLLKLYLLKGSLSNLGDINLAGIKPIFSRSMRLGSKGQAGVFEETLTLPLPGRGAYLVLARSKNQLAHSLVLVDALAMEVDEVVDGGRVRVTVRDVRGRPLPGARVQLKGTDNERFTAGNTDLRGIFIGEEQEGAVTVIAVNKGSYGLYRGTQALTPGDGDDDGRPQPARKRRGTIDFDESSIEGQLNMPAANTEQALDFFNQDVKGMAVQQAK